MGTDKLGTGNGSRWRQILKIPREAVVRAKQNPLNFYKACMYLELTHAVL